MALAKDDNSQEVIINSVIDKSPAEKAGLRTGDVLLTIASRPVTDLQGAVDAVRREKPGSMLVVGIRREGTEREFSAKVAPFPFAFFGILG